MNESVVTLFRGANRRESERLLHKDFSNDNITWWSTNDKIIDHYYDGIGLKLVIQIIPEEQKHYTAEPCPGYSGFGKVITKYPKDSVWFSISDSYIRDNLISIEEIFEWTSEDDY